MKRGLLGSSILLVWHLSGAAGASLPPWGGQDLAQLLARADGLLGEARTLYEEARAKGSEKGFLDAGFKVEEARIKYLVLLEMGDAEQQKTAADRIRKVKELARLIQEGKDAVAGTPRDPPPAAGKAPGAPEPPSAPGAAGAPARRPVPEAAQQRDAEKLLRDVFKADYAKKGAGDRLSLARTLLARAEKGKNDPVSLWVLFHEAEELAVQAGDASCAVEAIEAAARIFDIDPLPQKAAALAGLARSVREPVDSQILGKALLGLIDDLVSADQYEQAEKTAASALQCARRAGDPGLAARITARAAEVGEAKALFVPLRSSALRSGDPAVQSDMGRFLCFVKGSWDVGVRYLAQGSDLPLQALAARELALTREPEAIAAVADGWADLAAREKSALRKSQMNLHARTLYDSALPEATGILRMKVEKRLAELGGPLAEGRRGINLLALVDVEQDAYVGAWQRSGPVLVAPARTGGMSTIRIPYVPPEEYELKYVIASPGGTGSIDLGMAGPASHFSVVLDGWEPNAISGLHCLDGQVAANNETAYRNRIFEDTKPRTIVCTVRKGSVKVSVDGRIIIDWKGDLVHLTLDGGAYAPVSDPQALFLGSWQAYQISKIELTPLSGHGRRIR